MTPDQVSDLECRLAADELDIKACHLHGVEASVCGCKIDMRCAVCGHDPESHKAGTGQCYRCPAHTRCIAWQPKVKA